MITPTLANNFLKDLLGFYYSGGWYQDTCYLGLSSTKPVATSTTVYTTTEPTSEVGYSRVAIRNNSGNWSEGAYYRFAATEDLMGMTNVDEIHFNVATGSWGALPYVCLFSAKTGGTLLAYAPLTTALTVATGYIPTIAVGGATIRITDEESGS